MIDIKFKKLDDRAKTPVKAHDTDAGFDIYAVGEPDSLGGGKFLYHTGIAVEIPEGYELQVRPRSSINKYDLILANGPGTIDASYRGEIMVCFRSTHHRKPLPEGSPHYEPKQYKDGDKIAQLVLAVVPKARFVEVAELSDTKRGVGGFGSTGQ